MAARVAAGDPRETVGACADHRDLIRQTTPDAIAIFTPHRAHYRPAMDALQAGCPVFIEKPLSTNVQEAAAIVSLASCVILISAATCGAIADRTGRAALILSVALCCGMAVLSLLSHVEWAVAPRLAYGPFGIAPAGLIMALTGCAMGPK